MNIWVAISGIIGALGLGGVIMHFIKKREYEAKVEGMMSNTDIAERNSEVKNAREWQQVYADTIDFVNKQLEAEREMCDAKIAALQSEMELLKKEMQLVKTRCKNNCFEDAA